jgi:hypothetical protein
MQPNIKTSSSPPSNIQSSKSTLTENSTVLDCSNKTNGTITSTSSNVSSNKYDENLRGIKITNLPSRSQSKKKFFHFFLNKVLIIGFFVYI